MGTKLFFTGLALVMALGGIFNVAGASFAGALLMIIGAVAIWFNV